MRVVPGRRFPRDCQYSGVIATKKSLSKLHSSQSGRSPFSDQQTCQSQRQEKPSVHYSRSRKRLLTISDHLQEARRLWNLHSSFPRKQRVFHSSSPATNLLSPSTNITISAPSYFLMTLMDQISSLSAWEASTSCEWLENSRKKA